MAEYYKWLNPDRMPANGGCGQWPEPGEWLHVEGALEPCKRGLHLCRERHLLDWCAPELWRAEIKPGTETIECTDKVVVRGARLVERVETWNERTARLFAADCAEYVLHVADVTDDRSWAAVDTARAYVWGYCNKDDLAAAGTPLGPPLGAI